ncbi:MAG: J domain-containing protein [Bacteroidetes bacterium]|nr:MAG: J domain-containing protein [Bacteroidota bacterium]
MHLKDYYQILELEPSATMQEIKKAYRRLALQYHPDKTNNDKYAAVHFADVKEAYEVLTNPSKKYYYLQQRWYEQSIGKKTKQQATTPVAVLKQALELERYAAQIDVFRMDKGGLRDYILNLVSDETIEKLSGFNEPDITISIIDSIMKSGRVLTPDYTKEIVRQLYKLAGKNDVQSLRIRNFETKLTKQDQQEKYSFVIAIVITALICLLIWLAGR